MKCSNCNWPNRPGEKNCIKCGAPLTDSAAPKVQANHNPTVMNNPGGSPFSSPRPQSPRPAAQTIPAQPVQPVQTPAPGPAQAAPRPIAPVNPNVCPRCNYPLRPGMNECPNCNYQFGQGQPRQQPQQPQMRPRPA
ncbi:MAG: zinc ribbon domain-containing protein, partial [Muribaculaceae bacterium]|nr:zinc ribbon domain-containing protein [Muribaculaceae bacterium]